MGEIKLLETFKDLVDQCSTSITLGDDKEIYRELGVNTQNGYSSRDITNVIYDNIRGLLTITNPKEEHTIRRNIIKEFRTELVYRYVLYNEDPIEYIKVLNVINDSCRNGVDYLFSLSMKEKWKKAIINCKNYNLYAPGTFPASLKQLRKDYPKDYDVASSVKKLMSYGCKIEIEDSTIIITEGIEAIVEKIDGMVSKFGGINLSRALFNHLKRQGRYSTDLKRYFLTRNVSGISFDQQPQTPFGYLFNLCAKYPIEKKKVSQQKLNEIIDLSTTLINGAYGVQHYNLWEFYFKTGEPIIKFITELSLWDSLFSITQSNPDKTFSIIESLFSFIPEEDFIDTVGFNLEVLLKVIKEAQFFSEGKFGAVTIYHSKVCKNLKDVEKLLVLKILNFLSHQEYPNAQYDLPSDNLKIDFYLKPLIKLGKTKFMLMDNSWCSPNYYEAIVSGFRESRKNIDSDLGFQLELFLQKRLDSNNITFSTGEYRVDGIDGECDFLIESDEAITIIEVKKKPFSRKSKSGIDINIILDLSESLLASQVQAGRTEIFLRDKGEITLIDRDGNSSLIKLKGRTIERIALTQLDYGGFQDRTILKQFLKTLLSYSFSTYSEDPDIIKKFEKLEKIRLNFVEQYIKLSKLDKQFVKHPFFSCWFLSMNQLLEIVDLSSDNNSFYNTLKSTKYLTTSSLDWYKEFDFAKGIRQPKL